MNERLLQFIWQFQYFNKQDLYSIKREVLEILYQGDYNQNQGPDFINGHIKIDGQSWVGNVELHIKTSDWRKHKHDDDSNYKNVILHVVWEDDGGHANIPVLELKGKVSTLMLHRYQELLHSNAFIPCQNSLQSIDNLVWTSWKDRLVAERLIRRSTSIYEQLAQTGNNWEEIFWRMIARNFGMKINADSFEAIAASLPQTILARNKNSIRNLEALLMGQAGLLSLKHNDRYAFKLLKDYEHFQRKYELLPVNQPLYLLRMRPVNFPCIRLSQLAALIHHSLHLFSQIREDSTIKKIRNHFEVSASEYWDTHYRFGHNSKKKKKYIGESMIDNIIINTISPLLFGYGDYHGDNNLKEKAILWLNETSAEKNTTIRKFQKLKIEPANAFDTQALLELKSNYCDKKRCLDCAIGNAILKNQGSSLQGSSLRGSSLQGSSLRGSSLRGSSLRSE